MSEQLTFKETKQKHSSPVQKCQSDLLGDKNEADEGARLEMLIDSSEVSLFSPYQNSNSSQANSILDSKSGYRLSSQAGEQTPPES